MSRASNKVEWTVEQVKRGRLPVRVVVVVWTVLIVLPLLNGFLTGEPVGFTVSVMTAIVAGFWYVGENWARIIAGCYFLFLTIGFIGLIITGLGDLFTTSYWPLIAGIAGTIFTGVVGVSLLRSKNMRAYLWYLGEKRKREDKKEIEELEAEANDESSERSGDNPTL